MFPKIVVLDLDGTVWSPDMYELWGGGGSPFSPTSFPDRLKDRKGTEVRLFSGVFTALADIKINESILCVASSTDEPSWARECLDKFQFEGKPLKESFQIIEIYKGSKNNHLQQIKDKTRSSSNQDILFIDNEHGNISTVNRLGIPSFHASDGLTIEAWKAALSYFASHRHKT